MERDRPRRGEPILITDAPDDPEKEIRRREIRYVAMMLFRAVCLVLAAVVVVQKPPLWGLWTVLCVIGTVLIPWLAVILANDRPPKKRQPVTPPAEVPGQLALPPTQDHRIIDAD